jgi:hypothetical protein
MKQVPVVFTRKSKRTSQHGTKNMKTCNLTTRTTRTIKYESKLMFHCGHNFSMDQFRNEVALWVKKLRGRYDAIFIEPENVSKIS